MRGRVVAVLLSMTQHASALTKIVKSAFLCSSSVSMSLVSYLCQSYFKAAECMPITAKKCITHTTFGKSLSHPDTGSGLHLAILDQGCVPGKSLFFS